MSLLRHKGAIRAGCALLLLSGVASGCGGGSPSAAARRSPAAPTAEVPPAVAPSASAQDYKVWLTSVSHPVALCVVAVSTTAESAAAFTKKQDGPAYTGQLLATADSLSASADQLDAAASAAPEPIPGLQARLSADCRQVGESARKVAGVIAGSAATQTFGPAIQAGEQAVQDLRDLFQTVQAEGIVGLPSLPAHFLTPV